MSGPHRSPVLGRALRLRCPRCGDGLLFRGLVQMHDACGHCGLSFRREPGFYLGSIYLNYGATVIVTGLLYAALVLGAGASHEITLGICLAVAVLLPVLLFRHARSLLLALDSSVNSRQAGAVGDAEEATAASGREVHSARELRALSGDDARAGCLMGIVLVLIILFGLLMAAATLWFASQSDDRVSARETPGSRVRGAPARARA
ncbi:MAG: DUF983 domain-containing protein [Planctomycetia bacterium]